ncbi:MAG: hypothetical protein H8E28_12195 [Anaerolineae bacterium]|nr:hypothetical protein [Anaerolineae bacterium]
MTNVEQRPNPQTFGQKLLADLAQMNTVQTIRGEDEMLVLFAEEAHQGVDIETRYPDFYQNLLQNPDLRQAFIDLIEALEPGEQHPLPVKPNISLEFLKTQSPRPQLEWLNPEHWRMGWQHTFEKLCQIFSPPDLAYRLDVTAIDDPLFMLLREDFEISQAVYSVALDCTLAKGTDEALTPYLNLAVTLGTAQSRPTFPLQARLQWGDYDASITLDEAGRSCFPDIPLQAAFDAEFNPIEVDFNFTLEARP